MKVIDEVWKPIKYYEGLYEISSLGRIRSLDHLRQTGRSAYIQKGKEIKLGLNGKTGYLIVSLSKNGTSTTYRVHKLVAETFLPNPNNYKCVNHINEVKTDNRIDNLEWCSHKYNSNYGNRNKKIADKLSIKIDQYSLDDEYIKTWNSSVEIEKTLGIKQSNICLCCKGKRDSVGNYKWKYHELNKIKKEGK